MARRILVVDDEAATRAAIRVYLESHGFGVTEAGSIAQAERAFLERRAEAAIVDYRLPDGDALSLIPRLRALDPFVAVVVLTGHGTIELAVQAIQAGADQFLTKPVALPALGILLHRLAEAARDRRARVAFRSSAGEPPDPFVGNSAAVRELESLARRVLDLPVPILLLGETGAGKGVLARWIHANGPRAAEPWVDVNCAGLGRDFLESEMFGHEKGAFTGAEAAKPGLLEIADGGVLFLDEIGDLDPAVQGKLLKVLEEGRFRRLGEVRDRRVDVRLIAATHRDLEAWTREGRFREDLWFRISAMPIRIPSLRDRASDLPTLASRLLDSVAPSSPPELTPAALAALQSYAWPGNVRELRNVLERAWILRRGPTIDVEDLRLAPPPSNLGDAGASLAEMERRHVLRTLAECGGRVSEAAARLQIPRSTLYERLKRWGIASGEAS